MKCKTTAALVALIGSTLIPSSQAATVTWVGGTTGNWQTGSNWFTTTIPAANDTVIIGAGNTVTYDGGGNLPGSITLNLNGILTNAGRSAIRMNNATITVGSTGGFSGPADFWDLDDADIVFNNGAQTNILAWENKDVNTYKFVLGTTGFTTLTPQRFYVGGGGTFNPGDISHATYTVDMAAYTGGTGIVTLVDYGTDFANMDNTKFQTATLSVINNGSYTANLQWNNTTEAVELNITAVPEPSATLIAGLGLAGMLFHRRRK